MARVFKTYPYEIGQLSLGAAGAQHQYVVDLLAT